MTLHLVETEIANDKKIRLRFHAFRNRFGAGVTRNRYDFGTMRLLDPVVGAAANEFAIDFHLDDRQVTTTSERCAFGVNVVDGDPDISRRELAGNTPNQREIVDQVDTINRDQKPDLPHFFGKMLHHAVHELHILQRQQGQRQGNLNLMVGGSELHGICERPRNNEL